MLWREKSGYCRKNTIYGTTALMLCKKLTISLNFSVSSSFFNNIRDIKYTKACIIGSSWEHTKFNVVGCIKWKEIESYNATFSLNLKVAHKHSGAVSSLYISFILSIHSRIK